MQPTVQIGIIGDFNPDFRPHTATDDALGHAADALDLSIQGQWLPTTSLEAHTDEMLQPFDALWCAPGSPYQSMDGALRAIRFAREAGWPFIGTCGGFQHVVIEYARNVLDFRNAQHAEYDPSASTLFVSALPCSLVGQTMQVHIEPGSRAFALYQKNPVAEQYYCTFGLNPTYQQVLHDGGLRMVGVDHEGAVRIVELPEHRFFLATLFVPQLTSSPGRPHPLITGYLRAALAFRDRRHSGKGAKAVS